MNRSARRVGLLVLALVALAAVAWAGRLWGEGVREALSFSLPWPWWGPKVHVGGQQFRPGVRLRPDVVDRLVLVDVDQPAIRDAGGWRHVLEQGVEAFRQRYPGVEVEIRVVKWSDWDRIVSGPLEGDQLPDVLGTPEATYRFPTALQVPLELYWRHLVPGDPALAILPGALVYARRGDHLWGIPRWMEWWGWARREGEARVISVDAGNPVTWWYLALQEQAPAEGGLGGSGVRSATPSQGEPGSPLELPSLWSEEAMERAVRWVTSVDAAAGKTEQGVPRSRRDRAVLEGVFEGSAQAAGPISGRLAYRFGWWPTGTASGKRPAILLAPRDPAEAARLPGPVLQASSYSVFARPGATSEHVQLAVELAVLMAQWTSRTITGRDGVVPVWRPDWTPELSHEESERQRRPEEPPPPPWWAGTTFPPATERLLTDGSSAGGGTGAGALDFADAAFERDVVAKAARDLVNGKLSLNAFVERVRR